MTTTLYENQHNQVIRTDDGIELITRHIRFDADSFHYLQDVKQRLARKTGRPPSNSLVMKAIIEEHRDAVGAETVSESLGVSDGDA